jgi:hypothetical protein
MTGTSSKMNSQSQITPSTWTQAITGKGGQNQQAAECLPLKDFRH